MKKRLKNKYLVPAIICLVVFIGLTCVYFLSGFSKENTISYLYVDQDDNIDSIYTKLKPIARTHSMSGFTTLVRHSSYADNIIVGRYAIKPGTSTFTLFRNLKNGNQSPVHLTIPSVRTLDKLATTISKKLMLDSATIYKALTDEQTCARYGYDTTTIAALFIPETYDVYWNISIDAFLNRMQKENKHFWNEIRMSKARQMKLTPVQVTTLASIIDEETTNEEEKPIIAGLYLNRLNLHTTEYPNGMPLQACPTVKFALKQFQLKRIYDWMLKTNSPFNTYINPGLPPGPIRIPTVAAIDAVLNHAHHNYLYMCAKEDFSGTHNFAATYQEHQANSKKYTEALNKRGVK